MISTYRSHIIVGLSCLAAGILIGLALGWKLYKPDMIMEAPAPEQRLEELNVVVLQRLPDFLINRSLGYDNDRLGPFSLPDTVNPFESLKEMFKVVSR